MKKSISAILLVMLAACSQVAEKPAARHSTVAPLPSGIDIESLSDAMVPARIDIDQINWDEGTISFQVFSKDLYDAVEISQLAAGDTLAFNGSGIVIDSIAREGSMVRINGGIEMGGAELIADEGGTYRGLMFDDHSTYSSLGTVTLPLAENFTLSDCGENPTDPQRTISKDIKKYLEEDDTDKNFYCLNTTVHVENGKVTNITRRWIP